MLGAIAVALAFAALHLPDLTYYPLATDDEVLLNETARTLATTGTLHSPLLTPDHRPRFALVQPPVQTMFVALTYSVVGFGMFQTRLAGLVWSAAAVALMFLVAARWTRQGLAAGVLAALLFGLHPLLNLSARIGRMDTLAIALLLLSYYYFRVAADTHKKSALVVSGAFASGACLTHFVCFGFVAAIVAVIAVSRRRYFHDAFFFAVGGSVVAVAATAAIWGEHIAYVQTLFAHGSMRSATGSVWQRIVAEALRWIADSTRAPLLFAAMFAALAHCVWRRFKGSAFQQEVAIVAVVMLAFNTALMSKTSGYYPLYVATFVLLLTAGWLTSLISVAGPFRCATLALIFAVVASGAAQLFVPRIIAFTIQRDSRDYDRVATVIASSVPAGSTVWSTPEAWYALARDGRSVRTPSLGYNSAPDPNVDDYAVLRAAVPLATDGFEEVHRFGDAIPRVAGRTFATTDYQLIVYRSLLRTQSRQ